MIIEQLAPGDRDLSRTDATSVFQDHALLSRMSFAESTSLGLEMKWRAEAVGNTRVPEIPDLWSISPVAPPGAHGAAGKGDHGPRTHKVFSCGPGHGQMIVPMVRFGEPGRELLVQHKHPSLTAACQELPVSCARGQTAAVGQPHGMEKLPFHPIPRWTRWSAGDAKSVRQTIVAPFADGVPVKRTGVEAAASTGCELHGPGHLELPPR